MLGFKKNKSLLLRIEFTKKGILLLTHAVVRRKIQQLVTRLRHVNIVTSLRQTNKVTPF